MHFTQENYWKEKVKCWLCDSFVKIFDLPKYRELANQLSRIIVGEDLYDTANKKLLNPVHEKADQIASGWARYQGDKETFPPANADEKLSGIVDFRKNAELKHPLVKASLNLQLPQVNNDKLYSDIIALIKQDITPFHNDFKKVYNYLFFALPKRLKTRNIGNLGAFWEILPEDSRIPDHNVWNHLGVVSAIGSSINDIDDISLTVFAITPVQDFISKARKLRDYWVGSILLSYLSFWGIKNIAETMGPDHIVYPSLQNQTLVEEWLKSSPAIGDLLKDHEDIEEMKRKSRDIAAFPNKFVFISASSEVQEICDRVKNAVNSKWIEISDTVLEYIKSQTAASDKLNTLWNNQVNNFWKYSYGSCKMLEVRDQKELSRILCEDKWELEMRTVRNLAGESSAIKIYGATHSLAQGILAAGKTKPTQVKNSQDGEKCPLCGDHEVLHDFVQAGTTSARDYDRGVKNFWDRLRATTNPAPDNFSQTGKNERLCAICTIKRYLPLARHSGDSILNSVLNEYESYPSTTEMALYSKLQSYSRTERKELCQKIHINETTSTENFFNIKVEDRDKYYAFLLMDGDKMGDLINGASVENYWNDVFASELAEKFENADFARNHPIRKVAKRKRTVTPAVHAMISDALNNFSRFGVKPAVERAGGKLIYTGGDDVCAILPIDNALKCAKEISEAYTLNFATYKDGKCQELASENATADKSAIAMHLGTGKYTAEEKTHISISAAIVIAHHKQPLKEVIWDAHKVLNEKAKKEAGRNALAIRLKKRSGGDRDFMIPWKEQNLFLNDATVLDSFGFVIEAINQGKFGQSLLYKLGFLKDSFEPARGKPQQLLAILKHEVKQSGKWDKKKSREDLEQDYDIYTRNLAGICFHEGHNWFTPEAPIIACFLAYPPAKKEVN